MKSTFVSTDIVETRIETAEAARTEVRAAFFLQRDLRVGRHAHAE